MCAASSAASWVRHPPNRVDVARDHRRASVCRAVHGMRIGDHRRWFVLASAWRPARDREGKNLLPWLCFACVQCGFGEGWVASSALGQAPDALLGRLRLRVARCRPPEVPLPPDPGVSEGPGRGFWGVQGRPEGVSTAAWAPWTSWMAPPQRPGGGKKAFGNGRGGSRGVFIGDPRPQGGWGTRIRPS